MLVLVGTAFSQQVIGTLLGWWVEVAALLVSGCVSSAGSFPLSSQHHCSLLRQDRLFCVSSIRLEFTIKDNIQPLNNVPRLEIWSV